MKIGGMLIGALLAAYRVLDSLPVVSSVSSGAGGLAENIDAGK